MTPQHPFWLPERRAWVTAEDLKVREALPRKDGTEEAITAISYQSGEATVYNFTVEGDHDYFVADVDALVHNCDDWFQVGEYFYRTVSLTEPPVDLVI